MARERITEDYGALIAAADCAIAEHRLAISEARDRIAALDAEQAALGHHPNTIAYRHGGLPALRGMGAGHILAHAGFYRLPYDEAIFRLSGVREAVDDDCLIVALRAVCESDPLLEVAGLAWLDGHDLLKRGGIDPFWISRPKLGLGQPAKLHGLTAIDADAHRALYTFTPTEMHRRFAAVADSEADTYGNLLGRVIDAGGTELRSIGAAASEADAAERYWSKCAGFVEHQRATGDRRWRWKPPLSRQGHHARTIADLKEIAMPAEHTRGHAANWLDDNGANPRFHKD